MPYPTHARSWTFSLRVQYRRSPSRLTRRRSASPQARWNPSAVAQRAGWARETSMPRWCVQALWAVLIVVLFGWPTVAN